MTVRQHKSAQLLLVFFNVGEVRQNEIYAQHLVVGKGHPAVYDHHIPAIFEHGDVFADLTYASQGYDFQFFFFCHK